MELGAVSHYQSLIVNPAQEIPQIVSKIMQFVFWCLTVELTSAQVFRFCSVTGELEAEVAAFFFFRRKALFLRSRPFDLT